MRQKASYQMILYGLIRRNTIREELNKLELYCGQEHFIRYIYLHPGCTQSNLAEGLQITPASVSISTKRLEKMGIIEKRSSSENLRDNNLYLTKKGEEVHEEIKDFFEELDDKIFKGMDKAETLQLEETLDKLLFNLTGKKTEELDIRYYINQEGK